MVRQVEWSNEALQDLFEIKGCIERVASAARSVVEEIELPAELLIDFPYARGVVRIVGVIHGSRLLANIDGRSFRETEQAEYQAT